MQFLEGDVQGSTAEIEHKYLTFALDEESYGVPVGQVVGIVLAEDWIPVPHTESYFLGLMDVRGQVLPLIDLKTKLDLELPEKTLGNRAIIIDIHDSRVALLVDRVFHVGSFPPESIDAGPPSIQDSSGNYVIGIGKQGDNFVVLLSPNELFANDEIKNLARHVAPEG